MQCNNPYWIEVDDESIPAPCGRCAFCLHKKRKEWVFRLQQEYKYSKGACFVTLTYDQKHLPEYYSLQKTDLQKFFKRLRKELEKEKRNFRYYAVGEYGTKKGRPHYHLLMFNLKKEDEKLIRKKWGKGLVHIGNVTEASIMYTLKYIMQPNGEEQKKPFRLMSRAFGIGGQFLSQERVDWYKQTYTTWVRHHDKKISMPRFYRTKIYYNENDKKIIREKMRNEGEIARLQFVSTCVREGLDPFEIEKQVKKSFVNGLEKSIKHSQKL